MPPFFRCQRPVDGRMLEVFGVGHANPKACYLESKKSRQRRLRRSALPRPVHLPTAKAALYSTLP
jgi:hypothetical protein